MTEDDTFKALSRASVPEMLRHYENWMFCFSKNSPVVDFGRLEDMCAHHGWTWNEFSIAGAIWLEKHKTVTSTPQE